MSRKRFGSVYNVLPNSDNHTPNPCNETTEKKVTKIKKKILFSPTTTEYKFLCNSFQSAMLIDGLQYYHVEGYFQSMKHALCGTEHVSRQARKIESPLGCRRTGNINLIADPKKLSKWNSELRDKVMRRAILAKFTTNTELANKLIATGDSELVELSEDDEYWGSGKDNRGKNMVGKILMEVRSKISAIYGEHDLNYK